MSKGNEQEGRKKQGNKGKWHTKNEGLVEKEWGRKK